VAAFMEGFKKRVKGGTLQFGIKVPPIPRRCHLQGGENSLL